MMTTPPALLPEIAERSADAAIAALYADIRATLSLRTVPLLYRVMAPEPGCLAWAWAMIGPLAASGVLAGLGASARAAVAAPAIAPPRAACRMAGLADAAADQAAAVVAAFNHANPMNLAAATILGAALATGRVPRPGTPAAAQAAPPPLPVRATAEMDADSRALMHFLASCGGVRPVSAMPTLWNALAPYPPALALAAAMLAPGFADGTIDRGAQALAASMASSVAMAPDAPCAPAPHAIAAQLGRVLPFFITTIPTMIVIGRHLAPLFARDDAA
jgi:hypothetical protein